MAHSITDLIDYDEIAKNN